MVAPPPYTWRHAPAIRRLRPRPGRAAVLASAGTRAPFDAGWRFVREDPADAGGRLAYAAIREAVLPTGDELVSDPRLRRARPRERARRRRVVRPPGLRRRGLAAARPAARLGHRGAVPAGAVGRHRQAARGRASAGTASASRCRQGRPGRQIAARPGRRHGVLGGLAERPLRRRLAVRLHVVPARPHAVRARGRERAGDPSRKPAGLVALVPGQRALSQRLAGQERPAARRATGACS